MRLLFVCAANVNRSKTFEKYFKKRFPQLDIKSAGIYSGYPNQLNEELMVWADKVYVMDLSQSRFIKHRYREYFDKVEVIGISDQYEVDSPELLDLINFWVGDKRW